MSVALEKDGASTKADPAKVGTSAGVASPLVPCALKAGSHSFAFHAQFFAVQDASPLSVARLKFQTPVHEAVLDA